MCELLWLSERCGLEKPVACEPPYSILRREIEISEISFCRKFGIGIACYQVLQGGWLSGKYRKAEPASSGRLAEKPGWLPPLPDAIWPRLETLAQMAHELGVSLAEYAIAWVLRHPEVSSAILGVRSPGNVASAVKASELKIPAEHLEKIEELFPLAMDLRWTFSAPKIRVWQ
jgi:aryl-alcohol dehydrogenase-like predicted oxidoreductase